MRPPDPLKSKPEEMLQAVRWLEGAEHFRTIKRQTRRSASSAYAWLALRLRDAYRVGLIKDGDQT